MYYVSRHAQPVNYKDPLQSGNLEVSLWLQIWLQIALFFQQIVGVFVPKAYVENENINNQFKTSCNFL